MTVVVDTSALTAIILGEPDAERYLDAMSSAAGDLHLSAATLVESSIVVEARQGAAAAADLRTLITRLAIAVEPLDGPQADLAVRAWRRFGKGRHPAGLNLGDCYAYALTASLGARLLYKGEDFSQTDVSAVLD